MISPFEVVLTEVRFSHGRQDRWHGTDIRLKGSLQKTAASEGPKDAAVTSPSCYSVRTHPRTADIAARLIGVGYAILNNSRPSLAASNLSSNKTSLPRICYQDYDNYGRIMDKLATLDALRLPSVEYSADELRAIIESYLGGIPVIVFRDDDKAWSASINASPEIKARYEQRLQEILSVMDEHRIILRERPSTPSH